MTPSGFGTYHSNHWPPAPLMWEDRNESIFFHSFFSAGVLATHWQSQLAGFLKLPACPPAAEQTGTGSQVLKSVFTVLVPLTTLAAEQWALGGGGRRWQSSEVTRAQIVANDCIPSEGWGLLLLLQKSPRVSGGNSVPNGAFKKSTDHEDSTFMKGLVLLLWNQGPDRIIVYHLTSLQLKQV